MRKSRSEERRRSPRVHCELWTHWIRRSGSVEAAVTDISDRGLFVRSTELPTMGEMVQLEVFLPAENVPLRLFVVVRSLSQADGRHGFGVELRQADDATLQRWKAFYKTQNLGPRG